MAVEIHESIMVKPAEATPEHRLWLSNLDLLVARKLVPTARFYRRRPASHGPAFFSPDVLKAALSKALVPFYPLAGRLAQDDGTGRLEIHCSGDGVLFVTARTDATIDDLAGVTTLSDELLRMLVPSPEDAGRAGILAVFQVTFFRCGGVCLGSAVHHMAADGVAAISFRRTWAAVARGGADEAATPPRPWLDRTLLRARSPPAVRFDHVEYPRRGHGGAAGGSTAESIPSDAVVFPLSKAQVSTLKRRAGAGAGNEGKKQVSTFNAVAAHVWRCACRARGLAGAEDSRLYMNADARSRLSPPLPAGYFGNAIFRASAAAKVEDLVSAPLGATAGTIAAATARMSDKHIRSLVDHLEQVVSDDGGDAAAELRLGRWVMPRTDLFVLSWVGLPSADDDFGWGRPSFAARASLKFNGLVYLVSSGDGGVDVGVTMEVESVARLKEMFYEELSDHPLASQTQVDSLVHGDKRSKL